MILDFHNPFVIVAFALAAVMCLASLAFAFAVCYIGYRVRRDMIRRIRATKRTIKIMND